MNKNKLSLPWTIFTKKCSQQTCYSSLQNICFKPEENKSQKIVVHWKCSLKKNKTNSISLQKKILTQKKFISKICSPTNLSVKKNNKEIQLSIVFKTITKIFFNPTFFPAKYYKPPKKYQKSTIFTKLKNPNCDKTQKQICDNSQNIKMQ